MGIDREEDDGGAIEPALQHLLRTKKKAKQPVHETKDPENDFSSEAFQISGRSIQEIDYLIEGLRGVRQKLTVDRDHLQLEMARHAEFSETVLQVTKIISESMAHVK
jgi:hypothetical protein